MRCVILLLFFKCHRFTPELILYHHINVKIPHFKTTKLNCKNVTKLSQCIFFMLGSFLKEIKMALQGLRYLPY